MVQRLFGNFDGYGSQEVKDCMVGFNFEDGEENVYLPICKVLTTDIDICRCLQALSGYDLFELKRRNYKKGKIKENQDQNQTQKQKEELVPTAISLLAAKDVIINGISEKRSYNDGSIWHGLTFEVPKHGLCICEGVDEYGPVGALRFRVICSERLLYRLKYNTKIISMNKKSGRSLCFSYVIKKNTMRRWLRPFCESTIKSCIRELSSININSRYLDNTINRLLINNMFCSGLFASLGNISKMSGVPIQKNLLKFEEQNRQRWSEPELDTWQYQQKLEIIPSSFFSFFFSSASNVVSSNLVTKNIYESYLIAQNEIPMLEITYLTNSPEIEDTRQFFIYTQKAVDNYLLNKINQSTSPSWLISQIPLPINDLSKWILIKNTKKEKEKEEEKDDDNNLAKKNNIIIIPATVSSEDLGQEWEIVHFSIEDIPTTNTNANFFTLNAHPRKIKSLRHDQQIESLIVLIVKEIWHFSSIKEVLQIFQLLQSSKMECTQNELPAIELTKVTENTLSLSLYPDK